MAQDDVTMDKVAQHPGEKPKEKVGNIVDYLQAPRRKRKSFVVMALGKGTQDLGTSIESFVRTNYKAIAVAQPRSSEELVKNFGRQVVLLVLDDEFIPIDQALELVRDMKKRKNATSIPVLFLTRHAENLVDAYNKILLPFQESDEYILYPKAEPNHVLSKVRQGLGASYRRRSRRYKVDIELSYFLLDDDKRHSGQLIDLSVHGGVIKAEDGRIYRLGEQLKLHLPVGDYLPSTMGDYLKLSAKVRRVFIGGTQAGISFEHMSEQQLYNITLFLTNLVNDQATRRVAAPKRPSR